MNAIDFEEWRFVSAIGSRRVNAPNLYEDLLKLLPPADAAGILAPIFRAAEG